MSALGDRVVGVPGGAVTGMTGGRVELAVVNVDGGAVVAESVQPARTSATARAASGRHFIRQRYGPGRLMGLRT